MGVEGRAEELVVASEFGLLQFARVVVELPDEDAVVADGQFFHLPPQLQDLLALTPHQVTHHGQVRLGGVLQVTTNSQFRALPETERLVIHPLICYNNHYHHYYYHYYVEAGT